MLRAGFISLKVPKKTRDGKRVFLGVFPFSPRLVSQEVAYYKKQGGGG